MGALVCCLVLLHQREELLRLVYEFRVVLVFVHAVWFWKLQTWFLLKNWAFAVWTCLACVLFRFKHTIFRGKYAWSFLKVSDWLPLTLCNLGLLSLAYFLTKFICPFCHFLDMLPWVKPCKPLFCNEFGVGIGTFLLVLLALFAILALQGWTAHPTCWRLSHELGWASVIQVLDSVF